MHQLENKFQVIFVLLACFNACLSQDFEPEPLFPEYGKTTTEDAIAETSVPATTSTIVERPTSQSTTIAAAPEISTEGLSTSTTPTTSSSSSPSTTESSEAATATAAPSTPNFQTSTIAPPTTGTQSEYTTLSSTTQTAFTTTYRPIYPLITSRPIQKCYFRKQQSRPQFYWTCEGPKWLYSMECFQCCQSENYAFAGCNQVHYSNCEQHYY